MSRIQQFTYLGCISLLFCISANATAQERKEREPQPTQDQVRPQPQAGQIDVRAETTVAGGDHQLTSFLAGKLMLCNNNEIELAKMATEKASHPDVKRFAQQLIQDHSQLNEQLARFAPDAVTRTIRTSTGAVDGVDGGRQTTRPDANRPDSDRPRDTREQPRETREQSQPPRETPRPNPETSDVPQRPDTDPNRRDPSATSTPRNQQSDQASRTQETQRLPVRGGGDPLMHQLCEIERQAKQHHLQAARRLLAEYQGQDFDMGFLGMQIAAHTALQAELSAISNVGPPEFQQLIKTASASVDQHLEMAKQLSEQLEDDRQPAQDQRRQNPRRQPTDRDR